MGLGDINLDLEDLMDSTENNDDSDEGRDISDLSKKEAFLLVEKEGQINLGQNKALIKCPCTKSAMLSDNKVNYMCSLSMRPDPEDGKQKPVCSGPLIGVKTMGISGKRKWKPGTGPKKKCPYRPYRFGDYEDNR